MGVYPNYGGVEMVSTILANQFINDGYDVTIVSFSQPVPQFAKLHLSDKCNLLSLSFPVFSIKNIKKLRQYIEAQHIDILINQWVVPFFTTLVWKIALWKIDCKVYSVHHNRPNTNKRIQSLDILISNGKTYLKPLRYIVREISRFSLSFCVRCSDKYILLSPSFIPIAKKYARISNSDKCVAIANPVTIVQPVSTQFVKEKEILYVGRIEYNQKRTYRIIDIWKELEKEYSNWRLTIVGDGDDRTDLEKRIVEYGLERVCITGFVNPVKYYSRASIMIMTSEYEGFPLVLVEGMTYGVVSVVYDSFEAVHDLITDGKNGVLCGKPFNVLSFVTMLKTILDDEINLKVMSANAIETSKRYTIDNIATEWYNLINQ